MENRSRSIHNISYIKRLVKIGNLYLAPKKKKEFVVHENTTDFNESLSRSNIQPSGLPPIRHVSISTLYRLPKVMSPPTIVQNFKRRDERNNEKKKKRK